MGGLIYFFLCIASFCCCVTFGFGFAGVGGVSEMETAWGAESPCDHGEHLTWERMAEASSWRSRSY